VRTIHLAHPARAQVGDDLVRAQPNSCGQPSLIQERPVAI
jgi:hypothetical protein